MQNELKKGPLLDDEGNLSEAGFSYRMVKQYDRSKIKAKKSRVKEWDYYYIGNNKHGIAFTIADNYLYGLGSVSLLDFEKKNVLNESRTNLKLANSSTEENEKEYLCYNLSDILNGLM